MCLHKKSADSGSFDNRSECMIKAAVKKIVPKCIKDARRRAIQRTKDIKYLKANEDNLKYLKDNAKYIEYFKQKEDYIHYVLDNSVYVEALYRGAAEISFSQSGEDLFIRLALRLMQKNEITYMDVGCNDPYELNNTAMLYKWFNVKKGVAVEPNPDMCDRIKRARPDAVCLNIGLCAVDRTGGGGYCPSM